MADRRRRGTGTNQEAVRRHNLATLLGHVHRSGGVSRARLTERMGLNRSTIADLVRELEDLAAVTPVDTGGGHDPAGRRRSAQHRRASRPGRPCSCWPPSSASTRWTWPASGLGWPAAGPDVDGHAGQPGARRRWST